MNEALTSAQMRAIEAAAIRSGTVTGLDLMERAGRGLVDAMLAEWPDAVAAPQRAVVLCGPGNNGGDGSVVARLLKARGWSVDVFLLGGADKLPPDARRNHDRWDGPVSDWSECRPAEWPAGTFVIDAVFGTGLSRPVGEEIWSVLAAAPTGRRVAVDMPSLLSSDTGQLLADWPGGPAAELTVTFHDRKRGHLAGAGPELCGKVVVADIGLAPWADAAREAGDG